MAFEDLHRPLEAAGLRGAVRWILIVSGILLVLQQFLGSYLVPALGLVPAYVTERYWLWQPVTYLFLHGGMFHWLFNMLILWMFGRELETRWGTAEFTRFFFICGLGAAACVTALSPHSHAPTIGSSGAIFGILVAFAMVFPEATLYLYFLVPVKAWQAAVLFGAIELFAVLGSSRSGVASFAHLGGMLTGFLYLRYGWQWGAPFRRVGRWFSAWRGRSPSKRRSAGSSSVELHEVTDDLVSEVDRILEKILKQGVESLTPSEKKLMDKYSRLKH